MKHLRYFEALARLKHFGRAAEDCAITQPALSVQIKELEAMLGAPLVERGGRQIRLTTLGVRFAERARDILQAVDALAEMARTDGNALSGPLRLGVIPTVAPYLLPQIIAELGRRFPGLELLPREAVTEALISSLLDGELDVSVVALPISEPALREFALFEEDFVLVRHQSDAEAPVPSPRQLREMRLLLLEEGHCFRDQALAFCEVSTARPRDLMEGSSLSTLVQMVGAGIGVTLVPEMALPLELRAADVAVARFEAPGPKRTIGLVWRKSNPLAGQLMELGAILRGLAPNRG